MKKKDMRGTVEAVWTQEKIGYHPFEIFLRGASFLYRLAILLRNRLFDLGLLRQEKLPCKVISVGNITVGGTGKTPMVIYLANLLKNKGFRPAVLSRGYKGKAKAPINIVSDGKRLFMKPEDCGDEPVLIAKSLNGVPVLTGPKRVLTGRVAMEQYGADVLILDDAFQHRQLARDADIVLLDTGKPLGNGFILPAGPLREPSSSLKRADFIVRTGADTVIAAVSSSKPEFRARHQAAAIVNGATGRDYPLENMRGCRVCAFAGIGSPESFRKTLTEVGAVVVAFLPFPDHHSYSREDIREIQKRAVEEKADMIVTTEKDGVKLSRFHMFLEKIDLLRVTMVFIPDEQQFIEALLEKLNHPSLQQDS
jgi:tetraacyldisaccharide 4'-kinase